MQRRNVDFPEPDGPRTTTTSPGATSRSMPLSTSSRSKDLCTLRALTKGGGTSDGAPSPSGRCTVMLRAGTTASDRPLPKAVPCATAFMAAPIVALDGGLHDVQDRGHHEIPGDGDEKQRDDLEGPVVDRLHGIEQIAHRDDAHQRGRLDHADQLVAGRRDDRAHGLWD